MLLIYSFLKNVKKMLMFISISRILNKFITNPLVGKI